MVFPYNESDILGVEDSKTITPPGVSPVYFKRPAPFIKRILSKAFKSTLGA